MIPIRLPREDKLQLIHRMQHYFETERGEHIGELAAEQLVDFVLKEAGPFVYNAAIAEARSVFQDKMNQLDDELYALEKPVKRGGR